MKNRLSFFTFLIACASIILVSLSYPKWQQKGTEATISWDVDGYYSYLPSFLIYQDPSEMKYYEEIQKTYQPTGESIMSFFHHESGNTIMKYSMGMSIMYLPGFLVAHFIASNSNYLADGYSFPYQAGLHFWSILVAFIGLWYCRKNLLKFFKDSTTSIVLLLMVLGTNYLNYSTIDVALSHNYLFTLYVILIFATIKWYESPNFKYSIIIGLCVGLASLARPTEIITILIPLLWGISNPKKIFERLSFFKNHFPKVCITGLIIIVCGCLQLLYWKSIGNSWLIYSYEDQGFTWLNPHVSNVLFSYRKGWFIYTPIMLFAIAGFYFLFKKYPKQFWAILAFFLLNFYLVSAWDIWWYGGGFGQRALIQSYAILVFPFAAFVEFVFKHDWSKWLFTPIFLFCIFLNGFQTWQAHGHGLTTEEMSKPYFWRIFLNFDVKKEDKILLDAKHSYNKTPKNAEEVFFNDFENLEDSLYISSISYSGFKALIINGDREFTPAIDIKTDGKWEKNKWLRISGHFYTEKYPRHWGWEMSKLVVRFEKDGSTVKERYILPERVLDKSKWKFASMDFKIDSIEFDNLKLFMWKPGGSNPIILDDLRLEVFDN